MIGMAARRRPARVGLVAAIAAALALVLAGALSTRPRAVAGAMGDDRVVATLDPARPAYSDLLRSRLRASRADPDDPDAAKAAARQLIEEGRNAGDSRLVGAALAVLRPVLGAADAEALHLAATARQYQHDFTGALELLDRALALAPAAADALLARASINTVVGRLDAADADCRRVYAVRSLELGFLCQSFVRMPTSAAWTAYERLEAVTARTELLLGPGLRGYALGLMGEIAALHGRRDLARAHFAAALAEDPGALRVRIMLADVLLADQSSAAALKLLDAAPEVDAVLLRRAIAADRLGQRPVFDAAKAELGRRFRRNLDLGLAAHAREEARYYLEVDPNPALALDRARVNWNLQHEIEDAQLLIDAAVAAKAPGAAAPVLRWIAEQGIAVPTLRIPEPVLVAAR
jgi:tetratricopeptide (TPR) repeat protein